MYKTMGIRGLYDGLEPLLFREVPFIMTKFLVFDTVRGLLFSLFPAAKETLNLSLLVSFLSGITAGEDLCVCVCVCVCVCLSGCEGNT